MGCQNVRNDYIKGEVLHSANNQINNNINDNNNIYTHNNNNNNNNVFNTSSFPNDPSKNKILSSIIHTNPQNLSQRPLSNLNTSSLKQSLTAIEKELLCLSLLIEINKARTSPQTYITVIDKYINQIQHNMKGSFIKVSDNSAITLSQGKTAFDDAKQFLMKQKSLPPLTTEPAIKIDFPPTIERCIDMDYIEQTIKSKYDDLVIKYGNNIRLKKFHFDVNIPSAEVSCVLQIVDDTQSNLIRRNNIFNENANVVNINCELVANGIICFYLAFGQKK